jgi:hypothetical protein
MVRVMFYTPGFLALLLLKAGEPTGFGISVELLMLASAAAVVGGLFIASHSDGGGADQSSRVGVASGALVLELLSAVPFLSAVPALFHELASSTLLHTHAPGAVNVSLGYSELLPAVAILPFMLYQLAGFGTLHIVVSKPVNLIINVFLFVMIVAASTANRQGDYELERRFAGVLVLGMAATVFYGVLKLKRMQADYLKRLPPREKDKDKDKKEKD